MPFILAASALLLLGNILCAGGRKKEKRIYSYIYKYTIVDKVIFYHERLKPR